MKKQQLNIEKLTLNKKVIALFDRQKVSGGSAQNNFTILELSCAGPNGNPFNCHVTKQCGV